KRSPAERSRGLSESGDVAVRVLHGRNQLAATDIPDRLLLFRAGGEEQLESLLDVVDLPVADRPGHALAVAVGIEPELEIAEPESDVVRLVGIRLDAEEPAVQAHRLNRGLDGVGECAPTR